MLLYVIVLAFGALAGVVINMLINQKNMVYSLIGSIIILLSTVFACFVIYYPFYFNSYNSLILALVVASLLFVAIYVGLRLLVNTVVLQKEGDIFAVSGANNRTAGKTTKSRSGSSRVKQSNVTAKTKPQLVKKVDTNNFVSYAGHASHQPRSVESAHQSIASDTAAPKNTANAAAFPVPVKTSGISYTENMETAALAQPLQSDQSSAAVQSKPVQSVVFAQSDASTQSLASDQEKPAQSAASLQTEQDERSITPDPSKPVQTIASAQTESRTFAIIETEPDGKANPAEQQSTLPQNDEISLDTKPQEPNVDKFTLVIDKATEMMANSKYRYASELLKACLNGASSTSQKKQADILLLECLIVSGQYDSAQKKWLEVLNKMYILEPSDKIKLKQLLLMLNSSGGKRDHEKEQRHKIY